MEKAFAVGAITAGASQYLAKQLPVTQGSLSKLSARPKEHAEASGLPLWDPYIHETELGRGTKVMAFSAAQKDPVFAIATQNKEAREKQDLQAIVDGDFTNLDLPRSLTITGFENIMY